MAQPQLTIQQQLSRCRTRLYDTKAKNTQLKKMLNKEKELNRQLVIEISQLERKLIENEYYSKEE